MTVHQPDAATLVVYASKAGATRDIAEVIGITMIVAGHRVSMLPVNEVTTLRPYGVVVLGSPIYHRRWRPEAVRFLRQHREALAGKDVWLFQSGPCGEQDEVRQLPLPAAVRRLADEIGARPAVTFGGKLDPATARGAIGRWMATGELAGDWRDWERIRAWATTVAEQSVHHA